MTGLLTGFSELDGLTGGLQPSDLIVVAGRPSMGKTAFVLTLAEHVAVEQQIPVGIFSLEMSKRQIADRMLGSRARVSTHRMRAGHLTDSEWVNLGIAYGPVVESKMFIDTSNDIGILEMQTKAKCLMAQHQIGLLIVDYFQLIGELEETVSYQNEVTFISNSLKSLATELDIPVIVVSQISCEAELESGEHRPQLADFGEFWALEKTADVVLFLYRPEMYHHARERERKSLEGIVEVGIAKHHNSNQNSIVRLAFIRDYTRLENLIRIPEASPSGDPAPF